MTDRCFWLLSSLLSELVEQPGTSSLLLGVRRIAEETTVSGGRGAGELLVAAAAANAAVPAALNAFINAFIAALAAAKGAVAARAALNSLLRES